MVRQWFLDMTLKILATKEKNTPKLKTYVLQTIHQETEETTHQKLESVNTWYISDKGIPSRIYKNLYNSIIKRKPNWKMGQGSK